MYEPFRCFSCLLGQQFFKLYQPKKRELSNPTVCQQVQEHPAFDLLPTKDTII
jgi:hypothetical protein